MRPSTAKAKAPPRRKQRTKGNLVAPNYVLRLMDHIGPSAAAKELGTTPGTLHRARNAGTVSKPFEVAAKGVWAALGYAEMEAASVQPPPRTQDLAEAVHAPTSEATVLMLVQVPRGRETIIEKTVNAIGGTVSVQA